MNLSEQLAAMQNTLQQLSSQLTEIQAQTAKLEEENERLRQRITPVISKNQDTAGGQKRCSSFMRKAIMFVQHILAVSMTEAVFFVWRY